MTRIISNINYSIPQCIVPYRHVARVGNFLTTGGAAGVESSTGELAETSELKRSRY